jgi:hypothetical protein
MSFPEFAWRTNNNNVNLQDTRSPSRDLNLGPPECESPLDHDVRSLPPHKVTFPASNIANHTEGYVFQLCVCNTSKITIQKCGFFYTMVNDFPFVPAVNTET